MLVNPPLALARRANLGYNACRTGHLFRYSETIRELKILNTAARGILRLERVVVK
jgi:hypothetical protein